MTMVGLSMGVLFAISRSSLFSLRGIASFWFGDKLNLAVAQRIAATPYTQTCRTETQKEKKKAKIKRQTND